MKNAGLSYGNEDLCQVGEFGELGAHRIRLPMKSIKHNSVVQDTSYKWLRNSVIINKIYFAGLPF